MKVKYFMLSLLGAVALSASAQEMTTAPVTQPANKTVFAPSCGNWFITLQGGVAAMFVNDNENADLFKDRLTFIPSLSIGKWHNPYFASRLKVEGYESAVFSGANGQNKLNHKFIAAHYDFMFDVVNYFSVYNPNRVFHLIPFVGMGYEYKKWDKIDDRVSALTAHAGLQMLFRLGRRVDFVLEGQASYNNFNLSQANKTYYSGLRGQVTAGLNFRLGKVGFEQVDPYRYDVINDLNNQINSLRSENAELSLRPESCPECPDQPVVENTSSFLTEKAVLFRNGKSTVDANQMINIFDAAEFVKNNEGHSLIVTGYAQKSESRHADLAEKRAKAVAQILTEKYGVSSDKIAVEWKEISEKAYDNNTWNRVVVIRSK
ncbi:OmpA family protein [Porphyromonas macacae]|nr:OmpA family protein [Porphyromonas macacae]